MLLKIMHLEDTNDCYNSIHAVTEDSITRLVDFMINNLHDETHGYDSTTEYIAFCQESESQWSDEEKAFLDLYQEADDKYEDVEIDENKKRMREYLFKLSEENKEVDLSACGNNMPFGFKITFGEIETDGSFGWNLYENHRYEEFYL